jgi:hypothetical protein
MFDRIIVSCDDSHFKDFWPTVAKSWNKYFPGKKVTLAFVTNRNEDDELISKMRQFGEVYLFKVVDGIPTPNLAKMARHILAGKFNNEVCMIEDIDTIPLQTSFINNILSKRSIGELLVVGSEVYNGCGTDQGKFPISNITSESHIFKKIINPDNLSDEDLFKSWVGTRVYDHKESISNTPDPTGVIGGFSDESLMRVLINKYSPNKSGIKEVERSVNIHRDWIDRSWWAIDTNRLKSDNYVCCNFLRPFSQYYRYCEPIVKYIWNDDNITKESVIYDN